MYTPDINRSVSDLAFSHLRLKTGKRAAILFLRLGILSAFATSGFADQPQVFVASGQRTVNTETASVDVQLLNRIKAIDSSRVVLHAQEPDARLASQLESLFSSLGVDNVELRYVDKVPDKVQVRFYHGSDGEAGQVFADVLALVFDTVAARDFKHYQPAPPKGLIEIWLP